MKKRKIIKIVPFQPEGEEIPIDEVELAQLIIECYRAQKPSRNRQNPDQIERRSSVDT